MLSDHYSIDCKLLITKASFLKSKKYLFEKQVPCEQAHGHGRERFAGHSDKNRDNKKIVSARWTMGREKRRERFNLSTSFSISHRPPLAFLFPSPQPLYNSRMSTYGRFEYKFVVALNRVRFS